jgi:GNAT superfamily N-acetyltransferase
MTDAQGHIAVHEATAERWPDFQALMGPRGGSGGCWCLLWRLDRKAFEAAEADENRLAMRRIFEENQVPGLLAYAEGAPVGWCSIAPRSAFPRLATSRILKPVDEAEVWSITCFLIAKTHRRRGVSLALLGAAAEFVRRRGGAILEGYPIEPKRADYPAVYAWVGLASAYRQAGFVEVARRSPTRPIMRKLL